MTHFAHRSAVLPIRRPTNPSLLRQYISSASAEVRSMRCRMRVEAEIGAGERR